MMGRAPVSIKPRHWASSGTAMSRRPSFGSILGWHDETSESERRGLNGCSRWLPCSTAKASPSFAS